MPDDPRGPLDDRLGDLGADVGRDEERGGAAARLAELDSEPEQERAGPPPAPPRPGSRYAWVVGVAFVIAIVVAGTQTLPNSGEGLRGPAAGEPLADFAAPLATGRLEGDANVRQERSSSRSGEEPPACQVRGRDVVNVCDLRRRPLVLAFIVTRAADCEPELDRVERVRRAFPDVNFAGVVSGEPRERVEQLVRERGWGFPVAVDRDGAVVNLFGVGVCPTTTFAHAGGRVRETRLGSLSEAELRASVQRLRPSRSGPPR